MKKIPTPVIITFCILAVALCGYAAYNAFSAGPAQSGNVAAIAAQVTASVPKNAPGLPPGIDPTKGATMGKK